MRWQRNWWMGVAIALLVAATLIQNNWTGSSRAQAEPPTASPSLPASPAGPPTAVPVAPLPTISPTAPGVPVPPLPTSPLVAPSPLSPSYPQGVAPVSPASTAPPLPVSGEYKDPEGRFKIGILQNYKVSPLAGSVLIESPDGSLAYTVLVRSQGQLALQGTDNDALVKIAQTAFQQGEGFQPGQWQAIPGGIKLDWTGSLTIAGKSQPIGGTILVRQLPTDVAMILIAATQTAAGQVPSAISALVDSLQTL
ncbi:hypothetical protein ACKFKG_20055 [Phormidesmis sp. 146-35]